MEFAVIQQCPDAGDRGAGDMTERGPWENWTGRAPLQGGDAFFGRAEATQEFMCVFRPDEPSSRYEALISVVVPNQVRAATCVPGLCRRCRVSKPE